MATDYDRFATVKNIVAAGFLGGGFYVIGVVEALGLLQANGKLGFACCNARQPLFFLLFIAGLTNQPATKNHRLKVRLDAQAAAQLGHHALNFNAGAAKAAEFLGEWHRHQAHSAQWLPQPSTEP